MKGNADVAKKKIDGIEASAAKVGDRHPGFYVGEAGSVSSGKALDNMFADQLKLAGERSIPITIVVPLLIFGALVAIGVPLLMALSGVIATTGVDPYRLHRPAVHPAPVGGRPFVVIAAHNR
jgi:RND superfamily putative drug exporter